MPVKTTKPAAKKAAAKPAAKTAAKKTTAKPAAKTTVKKTAAKPAAKPATKAVAKPAAKKTTAPKPTAIGLSVSGNKKIDTLRKEFNKQFPYLRLGLYYSYMRNESSKTPLKGDLTIASVRRGDTSGEISISGNKKIKSLEKEFDTVFGLYAQVCFTEKDGHRYYTSGSNDEKTLAAFNAECEKNGCKKGEWK